MIGLSGSSNLTIKDTSRIFVEYGTKLAYPHVPYYVF